MRRVKFLDITKNMVRLAVPAGLIALIGLSTESCLAQNQSNRFPESPIKASLACETQKIVSAKPFTLFVVFDIEPGWHIYYKDPGQSGMPTQVDLTLPKSFTAQPLSWPPAERFKEAGIVTYGYTKKVRLSTIITPSKDLKSGDLVSIKAAAKWLACKHSCVPGSSSFLLDLKVQSK